MKDEVRTDDDWHAWRIWSTTRDRFLRLRQRGPHWSFLVRKESFRASMTRPGKKSMLYRYSFLEVNKMCQLAEWKRGSKSRMLLLAHSGQSLLWTLTISCWRRSESRGWLQTVVRAWACFTFSPRSLFVLGCLWDGACFLVLLFVVHDLSVVSLLSTHDNLLFGTMTATIVMMSAA